MQAYINEVCEDLTLGVADIECKPHLFPALYSHVWADYRGQVRRGKQPTADRNEVVHCVIVWLASLDNA